MALTPIKLPPGVLKLATPAQSRGRWYDTNLVRWRQGRLSPVGGWQRTTSSPMAAPARKLHAWRDLNDILRYAIGRDDGLFVLEGDTINDITPTSFTVTPSLTSAGGFGAGHWNESTFGSARSAEYARLFSRPVGWSLDNFGVDLYGVSSSDGRLLQWSTTPSPLPSKATAVSGAPTNNRAMLVTQERHIMLLCPGGVPYRVAWSSREAPTNWNYTDITNTAGFFDLNISGRIQTAVKVRNGILIFTDNAVWLGRYVGAPYIYGFEEIGRDCALFSPFSLAVAGGSAVWMGPQGFWIFDGGNVRPLPSELSSFIFNDTDDLAGRSRVHAASNGTFPEVWWFYPSVGQTECDRYVVWSWEENWWANGKLARSAMLPSGISTYPVGSGVDGHIYFHENGWTDAGASRVGQVYAETGLINVAGGDRRFDVVQAQLDSGANYGRATLRALTREAPDAQDYVEGPFTPRADGWLDCRFSGRELRLRISAGADADWSVGEMRLDILPSGGRR